MPDGVNAIAFGMLAVATAGGGFAVLVSRNVMHAAFWVLEVMVAVGGLFLLLGAEFLSFVQVMVYAGAVSVLLVFTVMLTLRRREDAVRSLDFSAAAAALALVLGGVLLAALEAYSPEISEFARMPRGVSALGMELFTHWVLPFEVASLVLLVALVGAVWWAGGGER